MRRPFALIVLLLPILIQATSVRLFAQVTTATLARLVHDASGAVVPGASVLVTNEGTSVMRETVTDAGGEVRADCAAERHLLSQA